MKKLIRSSTNSVSVLIKCLSVNSPPLGIFDYKNVFLFKLNLKKFPPNDSCCNDKISSTCLVSMWKIINEKYHVYTISICQELSIFSFPVFDKKKMQKRDNF